MCRLPVHVTDFETGSLHKHKESSSSDSLRHQVVDRWSPTRVVGIRYEVEKEETADRDGSNVHRDLHSTPCDLGVTTYSVPSSCGRVRTIRRTTR